jgi:DNA-binding Xre family transcriptional regulator
LKKGRAVGINFPTLEQICRTLSCRPGDVLKLADEKKAGKKRAAKGR